MESIADLCTGTSVNETEKRKKYTEIGDGRPFIATKDVGFDHTICYDNGVRIPRRISSFRIAPEGAILLCVEGGSAGRKIARTNQEVCFGNKLCCVSPYLCSVQFVYFFLQSDVFFDYFHTNVTGIIGGLSINKFKALLVPLPPLEEQIRIGDQLSRLEELLLRL